MGIVRAFLRANVKTRGIKEIELSDRFINEETGKPEIFKIRGLSAKEDGDARNESFITSKNGPPTFDNVKYLFKLAAIAVIEPELKNEELQNDYGVRSPEDLLSVMLLAGEFNDLIQEVMDYSGIKPQLKKVEEAKNS